MNGEFLQIADDAVRAVANAPRPGFGGADQKNDLLSFTRHELGEFLRERCDVPPYRARQVFHWFYRQGVSDFGQMSNLSGALRSRLAELLYVPTAPIRQRQISRDGTRKYLIELDGGECVEAVMIKQPTRMTLCVSSQVGCGMGCRFCRTATMGFRRNLSVSEILRQVRTVAEDAANFSDMFTNIVFMGMGEPLHNLRNVLGAISVLTDELGFGLGPRKITVSTSGLVPAIKRFGEADTGVNLAVSLNATTDEVRNEIMPVNRAFPLEKLLSTLREFPLKGRKLITMEYVMLEGVNTSREDLKRLPRLLNGIPCKVNLIPYNENAALGFKAPSRETIELWHSSLNGRGINATVRWSKGLDIDAACGQLATSGEKTS